MPDSLMDARKGHRYSYNSGGNQPNLAEFLGRFLADVSSRFPKNFCHRVVVKPFGQELAICNGPEGQPLFVAGADIVVVVYAKITEVRTT